MPFSHASNELAQSMETMQEATPDLRYTIDELYAVSHMHGEVPEDSRIASAIQHVEEAYTLLCGIVESTPLYRKSIFDHVRQADAYIADVPTSITSDVPDAIKPAKAEKPAKDATIAERHPDWPPGKIKFYYSGHGDAADMADVNEHIRPADIVLCENISPELVEVLQAMSQGSYPHSVDFLVETKALDGGRLPLKGSAYESLFRAIDSSGTHVGGIDTYNEERAELTAPPPNVVSKDTYEENLAVYKQRIYRQAELQNRREADMLAKFEAEIERILAEHPELKDKEDLQVVVTIGAYHTQLQEKLDAISGMPSESYTTSNTMLNPFSEAVFLASKGQEVPRELVERNFMENVMGACLNSFLPPDELRESRTVEQYIAYTSSVFSSAEMRDIYNRQREGTLIVEYVESMLQAKGLGPIPETKAQFFNWVWRHERNIGKR